MTNVAAALAAAPDIVGRCTLIWIGGSNNGAGDYNEHTDPAAARFVFDQSELDIIQFPRETYQLVVCSMADWRSALRTAANSDAGSGNVSSHCQEDRKGVSRRPASRRPWQPEPPGSGVVM